MPASIDQERLSEFQTRMSRWVSSQGLMFQLRHASGFRGAGSTLFAGFLALLVRLLLVVAVCAAILWLYLMKRVEFGWFRTDLGENLAEAVSADVANIGELHTERGSLLIGKATLEGSANAFFYEAELQGVRTKMELLDGVTRGWDGEKIDVEELHIRLKGGAESDEEAARAFSSLFVDSGDFTYERMTVLDANLSWGYSAFNRGQIRNSVMDVVPAGDGWKVVFTGGTFSQNWLQRLDIERIEAEIRKDGIEITEAKLKKGNGTVRFTVKIGGGARPKLTGAGAFGSIEIQDFLDPEFRDFVGGGISGTFTISGSTNTQQGVELTAKMKLEEGDMVALYDRIAVFRAISAVDRMHSYKKVRFSTGKFGLRTGGGTVRIDDIWLDAPQLLRLEGHFLVRPPTDEEIAGSLNLEQRSTIGLVSDQVNEGSGSDNLTLKRAGVAGDREVEKVSPSIILTKQLGAGGLDGLEDEARLRKRREPQVQGLLRLGVTEEAFSRSARLANLYPLDAESGLRWLELPAKGSVYSLGVSLAEELYKQSRADR